jgi:HSP20 family molecular chaperone IbpA
MGFGSTLQGSARSWRALWPTSYQDGLERRNLTIPRESAGGMIGEPSLYPKDPEWEIIDDNRDYQLIIDFPYHRDREIAVESEDGVLAIRSLKEDAPPRYHIEFDLPQEVVEESLKWVFNNGALILHFDKKKG